VPIYGAIAIPPVEDTGVATEVGETDVPEMTNDVTFPSLVKPHSVDPPASLLTAMPPLFRRLSAVIVWTGDPSVEPDTGIAER
jgi:hypothetical protein